MDPSVFILVVDDNAELASLLAAGIEARGRRAVVAKTGAEARAELARARPAAAVVDLLLPDVMGSEILDAMKSAGVPSIAITGVFKGARYAAEMKDKHGVRAFFEKPFSAGTLFHALDEILGPSDDGWESISEDDLPPAEIIDLEDEDEVAAEPLPATAVVSGPAHASDIAGAIAEVLEGSTDLDLAEVSGHGLPELRSTTAASQPAREGALPAQGELRSPPVPAPETHHREAAPALDLLPSTPTAPAPAAKPRRRTLHSGDLAATSVPKLLVAFYADQETGELFLKRGKVQKTILLRHGRPIAATSNLSSERFAKFAAQHGVEPARAEAAASTAKAEGKRTAEVMVAQGLIDERTRRRLTEAQARQIVTSTFAWDSGAYEFHLRQKLPAGLVPLALPLAELVLQGCKTIPLVLLRKMVPADASLAPAPDPSVQLHELPLEAKEAMLVAAADGTKPVGDLLALAELEERQALALLCALRALGLVTETERVMASTKRMGFL